MNLNPVEWSQAQDLLVKLVQVLTPLTLRTVPASFFLNRRFFIPPSVLQEDFQATSLKHPVRLLTTLHSVQKEVERWIGEVSTEEPPAENQVRPLPRNELKRIEKEAVRSAPKEAPPLSTQAKKLIVQVQDAISKLATSTNIQDPKETPLRETLRKLKPNLDRIIEAVQNDKEKIPDLERADAIRPMVPRSSREELIRKLSSVPIAEPRHEELPEHRPIPTAQSLRQKQVSEIAKDFKKDLEKERVDEPVIHAAPFPAVRPKNGPIFRFGPTLPQKEAEEIQTATPIQHKGGVKKSSTESKPVPLVIPTEHPQQGHKVETKVTPRPVEITSLPGAPFVAETKRLIVSPKKKKRKGFWFKGEEEDRNNS